MKYTVRAAIAVLAAAWVGPAFAQTWCGKNFMPNQTVVPPGGQFQLPPTTSEPLLAFRCAPAFRPYLEEDAKDVVFVVDTPIVYRYIQGASPILISSSNSAVNSSGSSNLGQLEVTISINNRVSVKKDVPLNATGFEIPVDISALSTQKTAYSVSCTATYQSQTSSPQDQASSSKKQDFSTNTSLLYLPNKNGSVVKTDLRTGVLWARPANDTSGTFAPFISQGFYINFDEFLATNLTYIEQLKEQGFNTIHPIPPYGNGSQLEQVLNATLEQGLYFIFDMRSVYQNLTAVAEQVEAYQNLPNLLVWETAHEPDGNSDPLEAAQNAYDLIYELDGYHPVSIVLNCQDYFFTPYVGGADIVLEDAYPVGINATFSPVWHTPCTPDFGHCGCDNCKGFVYDIKARIQTYKDRLDILGFDRTKTVWAVPQAFGSGAYWNTTPTGQQWASMDITALNHGATGSISFQYPTTSGNIETIEGTAANLNAIITDIVQPFIVNPSVTSETFGINGVDAGLFFDGTTYLLMVANFNTSAEYVPWSDVGLGGITNVTTQVQRIFSVSQNTNETGLNFRLDGIGIYTVVLPKGKNATSD